MHQLQLIMKLPDYQVTPVYSLGQLYIRFQSIPSIYIYGKLSDFICTKLLTNTNRKGITFNQP